MQVGKKKEAHISSESIEGMYLSNVRVRERG